jgi:putative adhesin
MDEHRFHTPAPVELEIKVPVGDIEVETVDGDETTIVLDGNEKLMEMTEVRQEGDRVVVELRGKKPFGITISIGDFSFGNERLRVRARVPHESGAVLATAAGDMKLRGRYRSLDSKSASGDLRVDGQIAGDAAVKTVSGDVHLRHVGGELRVQSVSGDVVAQYVGGSIAAKSVSGDVRFESVREGDVTAQSVSGDIEVGVAAGTRLDVDAGSVSGDLSSEVPLASDPDAAEADGPLLVLRGKTVSGDFRVFRGQ